MRAVLVDGESPFVVGHGHHHIQCSSQCLEGDGDLAGGLGGFHPIEGRHHHIHRSSQCLREGRPLGPCLQNFSGDEGHYSLRDVRLVLEMATAHVEWEMDTITYNAAVQAWKVLGVWL